MIVECRTTVSPTGHCPAPRCRATDRPGHLGGGTFVPGVPCPACGHDRDSVQLGPARGSGLVNGAQPPFDVRHVYLGADRRLTVMVDADVVAVIDVTSDLARDEIADAGLDPDSLLAMLEALPARPTRSTA